MFAEITRDKGLNRGSDTEERLLCPKQTPWQKLAPPPQASELLTQMVIPVILRWQCAWLVNLSLSYSFLVGGEVHRFSHSLLY